MGYLDMRDHKKFNYINNILNIKTFYYFIAIIMLLLAFYTKIYIVEPFILLFIIYTSIYYNEKEIIYSTIFGIIILTIQDIYNLNVHINLYLVKLFTIIIAAYYIIRSSTIINNKNFKLKERIKELKGLFEVSKIVDDPDTRLERSLKEIVDTIPSAWQFPDDICVKIKYQDKEIKTNNYKDSNWCQKVDIKINKEKIGEIEVCYLNEHPIEFDNTPFLKEEYDLLQDMSERISSLIRHGKQQKKIKNQNQFLTITLDSIGDAVIVTDDEGRVVRMNTKAEELTDWKFSSAKGRDVNEIINLFDANNLEKEKYPINRAIKDGQIVSLSNSTILISKNGSRYHIRNGVAPIRDEEGIIYGAVMVFNDFTEKYNLLQDIKRRENLFSKAIKVSPYPITIYSESGEVKKINDAWTKISGYSKKEINNIEDWYEKAYGSRSEEVKKYVQKLFDIDEKVHDGEFEIKTKDGNKRVWDFSSAPLGNDEKGNRLIISMAVDVTKRKERVEKIKKLNRLYTILSDVNELIVRSKSLDELLNKTCEVFTNQGDYNSVWIGKLEDGKNKLKIMGASGEYQAIIKNIIVDLDSKEFSEKIGKIHDINSKIITDYIKSDLKNGKEELLIQNNERSIAIFPLKLQGQIWGIMALCINEKNHYNDQEIELLTELKNDLSYAIDAINNKKIRKQAEINLIKSEEKYRSLFKNNYAPMLIIDPQNSQIIDANPAASNYYGWAHDILISKNINEINLKSEEVLDFEMEKALNNNSNIFEFKHQLKDGEIRDVEVFAGPIKIHDTEYLFSIIHDITERKEAEERIKHMTFHDRLTELYNRAYIEEEMKRIDTEEKLPISLIMGDLNNLKLINDTYGHEKGDELLVKTAEILRKCSRKEDIIARWGGDEFVIILPNTKLETSEKICNKIFDEIRKSYNESLISIALGSATKVDSDKDIFEVLNKAENRMYKNKISNRKSARSNVLSAFLNTLREKSYETEEHSSRMKRLCLKLGKKIGLSGSDLDRLSLLTSLHDIGKVTIPQELLNKVEKLTEEEWEKIKTHTKASYNILSSIDEFSDIAKPALHHHERWDGSGYPEGLSGEEIPILSRILTIVDAYDVMISGRPYQKPVSKEEALKEIKECAGTQFDPNIADEFLKMMVKQ